jgi:hypothetical protein
LNKSIKKAAIFRQLFADNSKSYRSGDGMIASSVSLSKKRALSILGMKLAVSPTLKT